LSFSFIFFFGRPQAPFYPHEAERKGATPTQYGFVFGIFELTVFVVSPIIGKNLGRIGAKRYGTRARFLKLLSGTLVRPKLAHVKILKVCYKLTTQLT
jgi:hypothetical protein